MREWFAANPDNDPAANWSALAAEALAFARSKSSKSSKSAKSSKA
jgi:hypothetical protein